MAETTVSPNATRIGLVLRSPTSPRSVRADLPLLEAVISGGQTGVDQAGLRAGKHLGLSTGGHAPRGFKTLDGPAPWLKADYGLTEHWSEDYARRTNNNVYAADATIRIAETFESAGELCTLRAIQKYKKPFLNITLHRSTDNQLVLLAHKVDPTDHVHTATAALISFLILHKIRVLNIAGNSEQTAPGIGVVAEDFLFNALSETAP